MTHRVGDRVVFTADNGKQFEAKVVSRPRRSKKTEIQVDNDPFPVLVYTNQLTKNGERDMATSAKELRQEAKSLGIRGFMKMSGPKLAAAIEEAKNGEVEKPKSAPKRSPKSKPKANSAPKRSKPPAKRTSAKKAAATKPAAKKSTAKSKAPAKKAAAKTKKAPARAKGPLAGKTGENPFRAGSNMALMADLLLKGGKRQTMINRLAKKITIQPYSANANELDVDFELDKRLGICAATMRDKHGFKIEKGGGRGRESGTLKVVPNPNARRKSK